MQKQDLVIYVYKTKEEVGAVGFYEGQVYGQRIIFSEYKNWPRLPIRNPEYLVIDGVRGSFLGVEKLGNDKFKEVIGDKIGPDTEKYFEFLGDLRYKDYPIVYLNESEIAEVKKITEKEILKIIDLMI